MNTSDLINPLNKIKLMRDRDQIFNNRIVEEARKSGNLGNPKPKTLEEAFNKIEIMQEEIGKLSKEILELKARIKN